MEHLTNCHGEWNALFALATSLPLMGTYITYYWKKNKLEVKDEL
jgi:hypothetical protein